MSGWWSEHMHLPIKFTVLYGYSSWHPQSYKRNNTDRSLQTTITNIIKMKKSGISLVVQWLRLRLPMQGVQVWSWAGELRSHVPYGQKNKKHNRSNSITNSIKILKKSLKYWENYQNFTQRHKVNKRCWKNGTSSRPAQQKAVTNFQLVKKTKLSVKYNQVNSNKSRYAYSLRTKMRLDR